MAAKGKEQVNVSQLFLDVSKNFRNGNFQEAQKVAGKSKLICDIRNKLYF